MMRASELFSVADTGVVVTGGASGIGLGIVEALASNGARVTILDLDAARIETVISRLRAEGFDVRGEAVDVRDGAALERAVDSAANHYGRLDTVFANAGVDSGPGFLNAWAGAQGSRDPAGALENYEQQRWQRVLDVNLTGVFLTARSAARWMKQRGRGRIIVTTSLASVRVEPAIGSAYMAAKAAVAHFMRSIALELAAYNITVNAIAPGFFVTNIGGGHAHNPQVQEAMSRVIPMHRVGLPRDIAGTALFLASAASDYVTGQEIFIDGGWGLGQAD
jgi:NAD(P)-dependent dehydrogenase (short-subunit alcohol dehydrogenase family)